MAGPEPIAAHQGEFSDLPLATLLRIDELADAFEAAWRVDATADPEAFAARLEGVNEAVREAIRRHLAVIRSELEAAAAMSRDAAYRQSSTAATVAAGGADAPTADAAADLATSAAPPRHIPAQLESVVIGEYQLLERLGAGGMGVVYKARHRRLDRLAAIKFPRIVGELGRDATARFLREAKLIGRLDHPHIVRAVDAGDSAYGPYLVTEYVDGETLDALVRREGPLPLDEAVRFARQAAQALAYAHAQGIIHRDVKPSNMLLDDRRRLRIVDFGLAKLVAEGSSEGSAAHHTEFGTFLGSVGYAAPEQLHPAQTVDERADVYALGCTMYFMLTGKTPFEGTFAERLLAERRWRAASLRIGRDDVPAAFEISWRRMVAHAPEDRFASMGDLERALCSDHAVGPHRATLRRLALAAAATGALLAGWSVWSRTDSSWSEAATRRAPLGPPPGAAMAPFDAAAARTLQQQWAEYLDRPVRQRSKCGATLVLIPPGEFLMGAADGTFAGPLPPRGDWRYRTAEVVRQEHTPQHRVVITRPLYFGETEITNAQFREFVEATGYVTDAERTRGWGKEDRGWLLRAGYSWRNLGQRLCEDEYPVINVTWNDAAALCDWLTKHDGAGAYRLPTEAEWEYVCRAGTTTEFHFGDDPADLAQFAWYDETSEGQFRPVRTKRPNPFGVYDLYGNRQEWCLDRYQADFYSASPTNDPLCDANVELRVLRGGTHTDLAAMCTSARRWSQEPDNPGAAGIRIVCELR